MNNFNSVKPLSEDSKPISLSDIVEHIPRMDWSQQIIKHTQLIQESFATGFNLAVR
jgi:hypothetical protein